jgi:hypothetical protein
MMVGVIRGADGAILGQHAVDPTAPGGLQQQLQQIAATRASVAPGLRVPLPDTIPGQVMLRFPLRFPDGSVQWVTKAIPMPNGIAIPPGVYQLMQR